MNFQMFKLVLEKAEVCGALRRKREAVELPSAKPRGPEER